jgi:hypothetical protein
MKKTRQFKNNRGSILVGVVALSILMAVAGIGFLQVTTTSVNNETAALESSKAFAAAESGIWIGSRWLRGFANFTALVAAQNGSDIGPFGATPISINGMDVYVTIPVQIAADAIPCVRIVAEVYKGGARSAATFKKRITMGDVRVQTFGNYGTFYDGYQSMDANDLTAGRWNTLASWNGWSNRTFNGRFHMNGMTNKLYNNTNRFNGYVTVANGNGQYNYGTGLNDFKNDYNFGVWGYGAGGTPTIAELDMIFTNRYVPNVDQIALTIPRRNAGTILADASIPVTNRIQLPRSFRDEGFGPNQYRPTLYFDGPNAFYQYQDAGGVYRVTTFGPAAGGSIDGMIFLADANNNLNVYTSAAGATGRFTVATANGRSIVPVGNVVTSDYDIASGTITDPASNNMIGLISGGFIAFNKTWTKRFSTDGANIMRYVSDHAAGSGVNALSGVTGGGVPGTADGFGMMHMSAAIIAIDAFTANLCPTIGNAALQVYNMKGCEWWDGAWEQNQFLPENYPFNDVRNRCEDYGLTLFGNHVLGGYAKVIYPGNVPVANFSGLPFNGTYAGQPRCNFRGCAGGNLIYTQDARMHRRDLQPPGFPVVQTIGNLLVLRLKNWSEGNTY